MDFGKLADISKVDFSIPKTGFQFLAKPNENPLEVYIGPPIWANKAWVGKIYPHDAKDANFLQYYAQQFNTIELNVTHYQIPNDETINRWKSQVHSSFKFCPKFPQVISHERQLIGTYDSTKLFVEQIMKLGENLGTAFLQLPPYLGFNRLNTVVEYLKAIPKDFETAIEFRHESWFEEKNWEKTLMALNELRIGTVITDVSGRRDVLNMSLSTDTLTLRFIANNLHPTDFTRTNDWVQKIKGWHRDGLKKANIFIHTEENTLAPELSNYWIGELNKKLDLDLKAATIRAEVVQASLF